MSRVRVSHARGDAGWHSEGPQPAVALFPTEFSGGTLVGSDTPSTATRGELALALAASHSNARRLPRRKKTQRPSRAYAQKCERPMKIAKEPCARRLNHVGPCHTRAALDYARDCRRSERAA